MFATKCKARLIFSSNRAIEKSLKEKVGHLMANEDDNAYFVVSNGSVMESFNTGRVKKITVIGRFIKVRTLNSTYCFEAVKR